MHFVCLPLLHSAHCNIIDLDYGVEMDNSHVVWLYVVRSHVRLCYSSTVCNHVIDCNV